MVNQVKRYELRLYDRVLVSFSVRADAFGDIVVAIDDADESARRLLPLPLTAGLSGGGLLAWLKSRVIPKNRRFVDQILAQAGLVAGDTFGILDVCLGLSVNDAYWVVPECFKGAYRDYNLFDNELDDALSLVAYTGYTSSQHRAAGLSTEWTTDGQYPKAWRRIDGDLFLFKAGTEGYANAGMEPYSEYFASQVAAVFGAAHVAYGLERWRGKLASVCPLMHGPDVAFVPFWLAAGQSRFPATLEAARRIGPAVFESVRDMLVFDAFVCNVDRHANNFGLLRDNRTGALMGASPLFDHNLSLFAGDMEGDYPSWPQKAGGLRPAGSNLTFDEVAALVMDERHRDALRGLLSFEFANHDACPVDERRLAALNAFIVSRARQLLAMPSVDAAELARSVAGSLPDDETVPAAEL